MISAQIDSNEKRLVRNLVNPERQAYEGAKMFYYWIIPTSTIYIIALHSYILEQSLRSQQNFNQLNEFSLAFLKIVAAAITYFYAVKYYRRCNQIDTTPILPLTSKYQTISETSIEQTSQFTSDKLMGCDKPNKVFCSICRITCDYRTRHCRKCQVCIQKYDHHCFWIGNCVGRHNHRQFYIFLALQTLMNTLIFASLLGTADLQSRNNVFLHYSLEAVKVCLEVLTIRFICFTGYLFMYHSMLISNGVTTWQHMSRTTISYLKHLPVGYNPFSKGIVNNWKAFINQKTRSSGQQILQQWNEFIPTYEQSKVLGPVFNLIDNQYYSCC